jgi:hypothetical protein
MNSLSPRLFIKLQIVSARRYSNYDRGGCCVSIFTLPPSALDSLHSLAGGRTRVMNVGYELIWGGGGGGCEDIAARSRTRLLVERRANYSSSFAILN